MSDFTEDGRREPDYDEIEEAHEWRMGSRLVYCPQCAKVCAKWYRGSAPSLEDPGSPPECACYEGSVEDEVGRLFCSDECKKGYHDA
jgi:hypothetical protein